MLQVTVKIWGIMYDCMGCEEEKERLQWDLQKKKVLSLEWTNWSRPTKHESLSETKRI